jgi:RimJ/RimL family protein N-acetyltransferase
MDQPNFRLSSWSPSKTEDLLHFANNSEIAKMLTNQFPHPYTKEAAKRFIEMAASHDPIRIFCIEVEGRAAGGIGIHPQSDVWAKNAELGYWLAQPYWGRGICTEAVKRVTCYAFEHLDIQRLFARPFGSNKASQRVLEKAGYQLECILKNTIFKDNGFQDEYIYAFRRDMLEQLESHQNMVVL